MAEPVSKFANLISTRNFNNPSELYRPPVKPFDSNLHESITEIHPPMDSTDDTPRPIKRRKLSFSKQEEEIPYPENFFSSPSPFTGAEQQPPAAVVKLFKESYAVHTIKMINVNRYEYAMTPPSTLNLLGSLDDYDIPSKIYRPPHYSLTSDVPERPREYAGLLFHLKGGEGITHLDTWDDSVPESAQSGRVLPLLSVGIGGWEYAGSPPSVKEVKRWLADDKRACPVGRSKMKSQVRFYCILFSVLSNSTLR
jgi:DNA polymerase zeta